MRKLILLLLFPALSFSQMSYNDLMSIKSVDTFKKVVIENGYEYNNTDDNDIIWYGYNIVKDSIEGNRSSKWASYQKSDGAFRFKLSRTNPVAEFLKSNTDNSKNEYDLIVDDIKAKCKYFEITENNGNSYVTYSCSESSYKGKIGFMVFEGSGYIMHFPPKD